MKLKDLILIMSICIAMLFTFTACGSDSTETKSADGDVETVEDESGQYVDIAGNWVVKEVTAPDGEVYTLDQIGKLGLEASDVEATLSIGEDGYVKYVINEKPEEGTCQFDGENISVEFGNDHKLTLTYVAQDDCIVQSNDDLKVSLTYYRVEDEEK